MKNTNTFLKTFFHLTSNFQIIKFNLFIMSKFTKKVRKVSRKIKMKKSNSKATKTEAEMGEVEVPEMEEIEVPKMGEVEVPEIGEVEVPEMGEMEVLYISPDIYIPKTDTYIRLPKDVPMKEEIEEIESTQFVDYYKCPIINCVQRTKWSKSKNKKWSKKGMFTSPKAEIVKIHLCISHDIPKRVQKQFWGFSPIPVYK